MIFGSGYAVTDEATILSIKEKLPLSKTAKDSLAVFYDLFDAYPQKQKSEIAEQIVSLAEKHNFQEALIDIIPQLSVLYNKDADKLNRLLEKTSKITNEHDRKSVKLFVDIQLAVHHATYMPLKERNKILLEYAKADMKPTYDIYQDILDLGRVVIFIGRSTQGDLYLEYLTRLENLIEKLPGDNSSIRNMFFTTAANVHTRNQNYAKALRCDSVLLDVIKDLEAKYAKMGREYRSYDRYKYISYRRMLSNYNGLTPEQVKDLYTKCAMLAEQDEEVHQDFYGTGLPTIYRLMSDNQYAEAVPRLQKAVEKEKSLNVRMRLLRMLVAASDSVGNNKVLLASLRDYNKILQATLDDHAKESYNELQIRYDINNLKKENMDLEIQKRDANLATSHKVTTVVLGALLILAVMLMVLYRSHFALRQKTRDLRAENERLRLHMEQILDDGKIVGTIDPRDTARVERVRREMTEK